MLNGYDNPNPTPRLPLTGLDFNHRFPPPPFDKLPPVKAFSDRVMDWIEKEEMRDKKPRHDSFVVIPSSGIWRKMGNRTFYRLYGLRYFQHGKQKNGLQEAIMKAQSRVFIKDGTYPIPSAGVTLKTNIHLEGETSTLTMLQATANNQKLLTVAGQNMPQMRLYHLGFDSTSNTYTGITGVDCNQTDFEVVQGGQNQLFYDFFCIGNGFSVLMDITGCEGSLVDTVWVPVTVPAGAPGDIIAKTYNGEFTLNRIFFAQPAGTTASIRVLGNQCRIYNTDVNRILCENQVENSITHTNFGGGIIMENCYMANGAPTAILGKIQNTANQTNTLDFLVMNNCYLVQGGSGNRAFFSGGGGTGEVFTIQAAWINGCFFTNSDNTAVWCRVNGSGNIIVVGTSGWYGQAGLHWEGNRIPITTSWIASGDNMTGGYGQFPFRPPPAQWEHNQPSLPVGTGSGNAKRHIYNRPVIVYQNGAVGTHVIESASIASPGQDIALPVDPTSLLLYPGDQIYYATTVPSAWKWYGL